MKFILNFAAFVAALVVVSHTHAALLLYEPFNYTNGPLVTSSAGLWSTHSGTTGQLEVISGRVDLRVPETEDVNVLIPGQPYAATSSTILYVSFTLQVTNLPSAAGQYFAHFKGSGTSNFRSKIYVLTSGAAAGKFRVGIGNAAGTIASATNAVDLAMNTDYRVYVRYGISNGLATLWVDPVSEASPAVTGTDATSGATLTSFALRQDTGIGVLQLDDLRIGTTFSDVYAAAVLVPPGISQQPASTTAIEGGAATFTGAATGSAPLSYQWKHFGTNLPSATNSTLALSQVTSAQAGDYVLTVSNPAGTTNSTVASLIVYGASASGRLTVVHYNVKGNFASDWSTNAAQVQAIARQLQYLNPDIIALNEIPNGMRYEMTNWMTAFFPAYTLAVSSNTDNAIRLGFISRYPITRSQSYLDSSSLTNFGYNGTFTRDLFEAEITVPGATEPLHVFTTHLKSGPDADSQDRRAAECSAISNFFATVFLPTHSARPYLLTGDMNEDLDIPLSHDNQPIQRLLGTPTGLRLTTPLNPFTLARFTHSIQGSNSLDARFDYILPAGLLASNLVTSQVFRTDLLPPPLPLNLNSNDDIVASDHLPLVMVFRYPDPPLLTSLNISQAGANLNWPALIGRQFTIESSTNLSQWRVVASNFTATAASQSWSTPATNRGEFFRVIRQP